MERYCLMASGSSSARTQIVSATIAQPQPKPTVSWKNTSTGLKTSMSGWKMFARGNMGQ